MRWKLEAESGDLIEVDALSGAPCLVILEVKDEQSGETCLAALSRAEVVSLAHALLRAGDHLTHAIRSSVETPSEPPPPRKVH